MDNLEFLRDFDPRRLIGRAWDIELPACWFDRLRAIQEQDGLDKALQVEYHARTLLHVMRPLKALDAAREEVVRGGTERCRECGGGIAGQGGLDWCIVCRRGVSPPIAPRTSRRS